MKPTGIWFKVAVPLLLAAAGFLILRNGRMVRERALEQRELARRMDEQRTLIHENPVSSMVFIAGGRQLATAGSSMGSLSLWDVASRTRLRQRWHLSGCIIPDCFFGQGRMMAHFSAYYGMEVYDTATSVPIRRIDWGKKVQSKWESLSSGLLSPDGKTLAILYWVPPYEGKKFVGSRLRLWDVDTGKLKHTLEDTPSAYGASVRSVVFSADSGTLATGTSNGEAALWDARTGKRRYKLSGHKGQVIIAFSPDGTLLASGSTDDGYGERGDGGVKLWDARRGALIRTVADAGSDVTALAFSPDGKRLAGGGGDGSAHVWDVDTGRLRQNLSRHEDGILSLAFSPGGEMLATGSRDRSVKLWHIE